MKKIVICTGGFDPIHSGHIRYLQKARELGDVLYVGVNSDKWLSHKKGRPFMPLDERLKIVQGIDVVDFTLKFNDDDGSARNAIREVRRMYPNDKIVFANGGDRTITNIPEMEIEDTNIEFAFGVGGEDKVNSSSWILQEWKAPKTARPWGYYRILHENTNEIKVKELTVDAGCCLSMQRHNERSELWFVAEGEASVYTVNQVSTDVEHIGFYKKFDHLFIDCNQWHKLCNETDKPLKIIEIQYGSNCVEEDIERL